MLNENVGPVCVEGDRGGGVGGWEKRGREVGEEGQKREK